MKKLGWFDMASSMVVGGWYGLRRFQIANSPELRVNRYGELKPDPNGIIDLPEHFTYHIFSRTGEPMSDGLRVPVAHDGMAVFTDPNGKTILVRNHEMGTD